MVDKCPESHAFFNRDRSEKARGGGGKKKGMHVQPGAIKRIRLKKMGKKQSGSPAPRVQGVLMKYDNRQGGGVTLRGGEREVPARKDGNHRNSRARQGPSEREGDMIPNKVVVRYESSESAG